MSNLKFTDKKQRRYSKRDVKESAIQGRNLQLLKFDASLFTVPVDIDMSNKNIQNVSAIKFTAHAAGIVPSSQEVLLEDNTTNQRLKIRFLNFPAVVWQFDLTDSCFPVKVEEVDSKYAEKYDLMEGMTDDRFEVKYPKTDDVLENYRGQPVAHYPSMGFTEDTLKEHMEAIKKRPWVPMKTMPKRLPTMGQYPYPPVESALIGRTEAKENLYQLMAHSYNTLQERCDLLEKRLEKLEKDAKGVKEPYVII